MPGVEGIKAGKAFIEIGVKDFGLRAGLAKAAASLKSFGAGVAHIGSIATLFDAIRFTAFTGTAKVFDSIGSAMVDAAERTGFTVEQLSALEFAVTQSGASFEDLESAIGRMQKNLVGMDEEAQGAQKSLARLGLTAADLAGKSEFEKFSVISDALSKISDAGERAGQAMLIFGRTGRKLSGVLSQGRAGFEAMTKAAAASGTLMSTEDAQAADAFGDSLGLLWRSIKMVTFQIGGALEPILRRIVGETQMVTSAVITWVKANREAIVAAFGVAAAAIAVSASVLVIGKLIAVIGSALGMVTGLISGIGAAFTFLLSPIGLVVAAIAGIGVALAMTTDAVAVLTDAFGKFRNFAAGVWKGISDAIASGDLALAGKIAWAGLKVVWKKGVFQLRTWWSEGIEAIANGLVDSAAFIQKTWLNMIAGMRNAWANWQIATQSITDEMAEGAMRAFIRLKTLFKTKEETDAALAEAQAAFEANKPGRDEAIRNEIANRNRQLEKDKAAVDARKELFKAAITADIQADIKAQRNELDAALAELANLRKKAKKQREEKEKDIAIAAAPSALAKATTLAGPAAGTFSASIARALGGAQSVQERQALAAERAEEHLRRLKDIEDKIRLVQFG